MSASRVPIWKRRGFLVGAIVIGVPLLGFAWYLLSPLFLNMTVVEDFPQAVSEQTAVTTTTTAAPSTTTATSATTTPTTEASSANSTVNVGVEPSTTVSTAEMAEPDPVALVVGEVMGADSFHQGTGTATIYELADGSRVLRLEDLDVTNGPDLHVYLSPVASPEGADEVTADGYVDLGSLKGNRGSQNYELPADFEIGDDLSVVIYCVPFHVIFATATLTSA